MAYYGKVDFNQPQGQVQPQGQNMALGAALQQPQNAPQGPSATPEQQQTDAANWKEQLQSLQKDPKAMHMLFLFGNRLAQGGNFADAASEVMNYQSQYVTALNKLQKEEAARTEEQRRYEVEGERTERFHTDKMGLEEKKLSQAERLAKTKLEAQQLQWQKEDQYRKQDIQVKLGAATAKTFADITEQVDSALFLNTPIDPKTEKPMEGAVLKAYRDHQINTLFNQATGYLQNIRFGDETVPQVQAPQAQTTPAVQTTGTPSFADFTAAVRAQNPSATDEQIKASYAHYYPGVKESALAATTPQTPKAEEFKGNKVEKRIYKDKLSALLRGGNSEYLDKMPGNDTSVSGKVERLTWRIQELGRLIQEAPQGDKERIGAKLQELNSKLAVYINRNQ